MVSAFNLEKALRLCDWREGGHVLEGTRRSTAVSWRQIVTLLPVASCAGTYFVITFTQPSQKLNILKVGISSHHPWWSENPIYVIFQRCVENKCLKYSTNAMSETNATIKWRFKTNKKRMQGFIYPALACCPEIVVVLLRCSQAHNVHWTL